MVAKVSPPTAGCPELLDHVDTMKTLLAFWAVGVDAHAFDAKVRGPKKFRFVATVKAVFAKPFGQPYLTGGFHEFNLLECAILILLTVFRTLFLEERHHLVAYPFSRCPWGR